MIPDASGESALPEFLKARTVALVFAASLVACLVGYLALATPGHWFSSTPDLGYGVKALRLARGVAAPARDAVVIARAAEDGNAVVSVETDFPAASYAQVVWIARAIPPDVHAALLWRTDVEPSRLNTLAISIESGQPAPVDLRNDSHWIGRIKGLALALHGPLANAVTVRGVIARPASVMETLVDRFREWTMYTPWNGSSINTVTGGADSQGLPLPLLLAAAIVLAAGPLFVIARHRAAATRAATGAAVIAITLGAWLVLDLRWSAQLLRQVGETAQQYAGKDWRERHLAADDGALFAFIDKVRSLLPDRQVRVFVVADADYLRARAVYHLYPYNAWYVPAQNLLPPVDRLHPGDWIVVYQRRGVQYDAAARRLRWDGGATVAADLKLADHGGALFEVQ
ncbi:MAG: hypothetical protein KGJ25_13990 [Betaproteobacteria bacterium]|nr:hypothetical protein [Betaproteobacteria bacterium]